MTSKEIEETEGKQESRRNPPVKHRFTPETAREMQRRSVAARRKNARAAREQLGKWLESDLKEAYAAYRRGFTSGERDDWRAADAVLNQVYGRPPTELELVAGAGATGVAIVLESAFQLDTPPAEIEAPAIEDNP